MKKILNSFMFLFVAASTMTMVGCKDDDNNGSSTNTDRQFMTMFITDNTRGKGSDYPYNSGLDGAYPHGNTIHLYWYGVKDCAGYQIQMALQPKVSGGSEAWAKIQGTSDLLVNKIVGPDQLDMVIKDLQYSTDYRFAIRALSKLDENNINDPSSFAHASNWFGHGNGRQWQEYLGIKTKDRYPTPFVVYVNQAETTENTMNVYFNRTIDDVGLTTSEEDVDKKKSFYENFNIDSDGKFGYKYLTVKPSPNNPNSTVDEKWKKYEIKEEDFAQGYVTITGLTPNSVYVIDVVDPTVAVDIDAKYNTGTYRSGGKPGEPILLKHDELLATQNTAALVNNDESRANTYALASEYNAAPLSPTLYDFISNTKLAEGQEFQLEGGKTYYIDGNDITCKGFILRTNPDDVKEGKRAKVICGIGKNSKVYDNPNGEQWQGSYTCFMFGRQPEAGEGGEIYMKELAFYDIDFDCPKAFNYGDNLAGIGVVSGNYFFNMYSDGMAVTLESLVIENCSFKRMVRGFIREQGANYKVWNNVLIKNNLFLDCGYYNQGAGGYCMIAGSGNNVNSNLYKNFVCTENTFYDSPFPAFISEEKEINWKAGAWNITFTNNTLINFNTRADGSIFKMRNLPNGSVFNVQNNLFILCKKPGDQRQLQMWGADIRGTQTLSNGSAGIVDLNFSNNWSTNNDLTNGSIFSSRQWTSTSNNFAKLVKDGKARLNGVLKAKTYEALEVSVANISATDLMEQPCPPYVATSANDRNMHRADALDGTATDFNVNLNFKNFDNEIVNNNVGASRWRVKQ